MRFRSIAVAVLFLLLAAGCAATVDVEVVDAAGDSSGDDQTAADDSGDEAGTGTPAASATATPEPAPTATAEPQPTSTPEPDPTATPEPTATTPPPPPTATPGPPPIEFVIAPNAPILGIPIGTEADLALLELDALIGEPDSDTGWDVGCPLDGPDDNERLVEWGDLDVYFERFDGTEKLRAWGYDIRLPEGGFPEPALVVLPGGSQVGDLASVVAAAAGLPVVFDDTFGINRVGAEGFEIIGFGPDDEATWGAFVPFVPTCE